jgi:hypothetical protein
MQKVASIILITIFILTILFHFLILFGLIPFTMVWGGRLENASEMYVFETVSIAINLLFLLIVLIKSQIIKIHISSKIINGFLWGMSVLFILNTIGNLASNNNLEKIIFTPITLVLAICGLILVLKKE